VAERASGGYLYLPMVPRGGRVATRSRQRAELVRRRLWREWSVARDHVSPQMGETLAAFEQWNLHTAAARQATYNRRIAEWFLEARGIAQPWRISPEDVEGYLAELRRVGRTARTIQAHRNSLRKLCRYLRGRGLLEGNPVDLVEVRPPPRRAPRYLDEAATAELLKRARAGPRWLARAIRLALYEGPRLGELVALRREHLLPAGILIENTKRGGWRTVPLFGQARALVDRLRTGPAGGLWPEHHPRWWGKLLEDLTEDLPPFGLAGGVGSRWHLLRSTFAVNQARRGATLWKLMAWLDHVNPTTTMRYVNLARAAGA